MEQDNHRKWLGGADYDLGQRHAICIDGPLAGGNWALLRNRPIAWLSEHPAHPYRAVEDEAGIWWYVYADSIDDDLSCPV